MKQYYVSIDFAETKPISSEEIIRMAFDPKTNDVYADYLRMVLKNAGNTISKIDREDLSSIDFGIHETGCIVPFGETLRHPYSKNFYKPLEEVIHELPPLPPSMLFTSDN